MKNIFLLLCIFLLSSTLYASKIGRITLEDMESKAEYIILGKVTDVERELDRDKITMEIRKLLKGNKLSKEKVSFWLTSRGGLKDFDPEVQIGSSIVAFLVEENGNFKKAYWGSIAIFTKPNYL